MFSKDKKLIEYSKKLSTGKRQSTHYEHSDIGYNYRLSNICAAIGFGQLEVLTDRINKKREIFNFYKTKLSKIDDIEFLDENENIFFKLLVNYDTEKTRIYNRSRGLTFVSK